MNYNIKLHALIFPIWAIILATSCTHTNKGRETTQDIYLQFTNNILLEETEWSQFHIESANTKDKRKRILLVGDSIVQGYFNGVQRNISKTVDCATYTTSKFVNNPYFLEELKILLKQYNFDLIHINNGLHGWAYTEEQYNNGLINILSLLKKEAPSSKIIWAMTTPLRKGGDPSNLSLKNQRVTERNKIAATIMAQAGITINDLYTHLIKHDEFYQMDGTHFNNEGNSYISAITAKIITDSLDRQ